jgi:hypothetical protein
MKTFLTILLVTLCAAASYGQTIKSLGFNTANGQVIANTGTNVLTFMGSNGIVIDAGGGQTITVNVSGINFQTGPNGSVLNIPFDDPVQLGGGVWDDPSVRSSLGFSTNLSGFWTATSSAVARTNLGLGATWLTNTNVTSFRTEIGLGKFLVSDDNIAAILGETVAALQVDGDDLEVNVPIRFMGTNSAPATRTNLGLGATNIVTFAGLTNNGDITINSTTASNGLLYIRRTNNEPFLGLANLLASNNTTVSNETLFRVGVAEATNQSAQFGFRSTNTNGSGVAVFSVFGFNALMMVGADASTNAVIFSGGGTNNEVMTLIRDGATEFARPIRFSTNASTRPETNAPANTTNVAAWVEFRIGTNSYRAPLYQ